MALWRKYRRRFWSCRARPYQAGFTVCSTASAASALHDNPAVVQSMGVQIAEQCPPGAVPVPLSDYSPEFFAGLLRQAGLPLPHLVLAGCQDHGFHPNGNRMGRMQAWTALLQSSALPANWIYEQPPAQCTRLLALQKRTGGPVADTGTCALLGALCVPEVMKRSWREGITIINVGNSHTVAALVYQGQVRGIYEHHTGMRTLQEYLADLEQFRRSWLPCEEVLAHGGHGTAFGPYCEEAGGYEPTYILGPKREFLQGQGQFLAPYGDMMLAGCFGLLWGWAHRGDDAGRL